MVSPASSPLDQPETSTSALEKATEETSTASGPPRIEGETTSQPSVRHHPLAIEPPKPEIVQPAEEEEVQSLEVGGTIVKLDRLGPMIVNSDGTISRIQNWQDLHPIEQERTVRLLVKKRNLVRLQKLDAAEGAEGAHEDKLTALKDADQKAT